MTKLFKTSAGAEYKLSSFEGTVLSVHEQENVVVNQDSPTMRYNATINQTFNEPGAIYSEVIKTSKVWIRTESGKDMHVDISDIPVALMAGHKLKIFMVSKPEENEGYYWAAKNLNTDEAKFKDLTHGYAMTDALGLSKLNRVTELLIKPAKWAVILWMVFAAYIYFTNHSSFFGISRALSDSSFILLSFIPLALINAFIPRKDYIKSMNEVSAQVKREVAV